MNNATHNVNITHHMYLYVFTEAIDKMWAEQQRHLECIQDPPEMNLYRITRITTINKVDLPYYKCVRGTNSLEGFHKYLPHMIPGTQAYCLHFFKAAVMWLHFCVYS